MKKMLALLLVAMMLLGMTAMAETTEPAAPTEATALVMTLDNVKYTEGADGVTAIRSLDDFSAMLAVDTTNGLEVTLGAYEGDDSLSFVVAKLEDKKVLVASNAMEETYAFDIPENVAANVDQLPALVRAALPAFMGMEMPMINAVELPKADLSSFAKMIGGKTTEENGVATTTFAVPAAMVDMLIAQLDSALETAAEEMPGLAMVGQLLSSFQESGMSIEMNGTLTDTADKQVCELGVLISTAEQKAEVPAVVITTTSVQNSFSLGVSMPSGEEMYTVGGVDFNTDPGRNAMSLSLNALGMITADVAINQDGGQQNIVVDSNVFGSEYKTTTTYGTDADGKQFSTNTTTFGTTTISTTGTGEYQQDGTYAGTLELAIDDSYSKKTLSADYYVVLGTYDSGYQMPATIVPITQMDANTAEAALKPLIDYFNEASAKNAA